MTNDGCTAMGHIYKNLIKNKNVATNRAFRPKVLLISDRQTTDDWKGPKRLL